MKKFTLETIDKKISFPFERVFIFTTKYQKKLAANEIHNPLACKIIVQTEKTLFHFLLVKPLIITKSKKEIEVKTISKFKKVTQEIPYFKGNSKKLKFLGKIYSSKKILEFSPQDLIDKDEIDTFNELHKVLKLKISPIIGGGF